MQNNAQKCILLTWSRWRTGRGRGLRGRLHVREFCRRTPKLVQTCSKWKKNVQRSLLYGCCFCFRKQNIFQFQIAWWINLVFCFVLETDSKRCSERAEHLRTTSASPHSSTCRSSSQVTKTKKHSAKTNARKYKKRSYLQKHYGILINTKNNF